MSNLLVLRFMGLVLKLLVRINWGSQDRESGVVLREDVDHFLQVLDGEAVAESLIR